MADAVERPPRKPGPGPPSLIITYLLLAVAVVIVPRTARALVSQLGRRRRTPLALAWPIGSAIFIVVLWIALPMWAAFAPTLVRPRFTWLGTVPTPEAVQPLQHRGGTIVATAVVVGMARQILIGLSLWWAPFRRRVGAAEDDAVRLFDGRPGVPRQSPTRRRLVGDVVSATLATLVLAGVLERAWLWALAFGVLFTVRLLRSGVIATSLVDRWKAVTARVLSVARVVILFLVTRTMTDALGETVITSYTRVALAVIAGAILVFVVFPGRPDQVPAAPPDASP